MSETSIPSLEEQLRGLTSWDGPTPELWRKAACAASARRASRASGLPRRPMPIWLTSSLAAALLLAVVGAWMTTRGWHDGVESRGSTASRDLEGARGGETVARCLANYDGLTVVGLPLADLPDYSDLAPEAGPQAGMMAAPVGRMAPTASPPPSYGLPTAGQYSDLAGTRQVVRKATIEMTTDDVRAAYLKASMLINEALGEYVQNSSLSGNEDRLEANLTLRVAAERLPDALNALRGLGEVRAETSGGEDVTTQVVDLDARLRNEQRVETELLELLERRQDAPLKEIIELRGTISVVRQNIERLAAQRQRLGRLVSLATVLVIIRTTDAPAVESGGVGAYLAESIGHAWEKGLTFLVDTLAGLLSILIGGLIWWVLLLVVIGLVLRRCRRRGT